MKENQSNKQPAVETGSGKQGQESTGSNQQVGMRNPHEVDQQEGNMDNGALGGNLEESPEVRDEHKER